MRFEVTASAKTDFQFYHFSFLENLILESPLDSKETKPVNPKGNQHWLFIGRTDAEAEAPVLWPPNVESQLTEKDSDAGKDWKQEEKGATEDEMVGWHHWLIDLSLSKLQEIVKKGKPGVLQSRGLRIGCDWVTEQQKQWQ